MPVTYDETRAWTVMLREFTPGDLADVMGVNDEALEGFLFGLLFNGTIEEVGRRNGHGRGLEELYRWVPLPPGPREHPTGVPEWRSPGCYSEVLTPRGMPVRIRSDRDNRRLMGQGSGGARRQLIMAERAWQRQQEAVARRREEQQRRDQAKKENASAAKRKAEAAAKARAEKRRAKHKDRMFDS